jgi:hypothetical protein
VAVQGQRRTVGDGFKFFVRLKHVYLSHRGCVKRIQKRELPAALTKKDDRTNGILLNLWPLDSIHEIPGYIPDGIHVFYVLTSLAGFAKNQIHHMIESFNLKPSETQLYFERCLR